MVVGAGLRGRVGIGGERRGVAVVVRWRVHGGRCGYAGVDNGAVRCGKPAGRRIERKMMLLGGSDVRLGSRARIVAVSKGRSRMRVGRWHLGERWMMGSCRI